jgi:hypothetical protein
MLALLADGSREGVEGGGGGGSEPVPTSEKMPEPEFLNF